MSFPTDSDEVEKVATPPRIEPLSTSVRIPVPSVVVPSMNVTVPSGGPPPGPTTPTPAVKVTS